jgi:hypothetical protein
MKRLRGRLLGRRVAPRGKPRVIRENPAQANLKRLRALRYKW